MILSNETMNYKKCVTQRKILHGRYKMHIKTLPSVYDEVARSVIVLSSSVNKSDETRESTVLIQWDTKGNSEWCGTH